MGVRTGSGARPSPASPVQDTSEDTPLLRNGLADDAHDASSMTSRTSVSNAAALPWMLTYLSCRMLPGDTDIVVGGYASSDEQGSIDSEEYLANEGGGVKPGNGSLQEMGLPQSPENNSFRCNQHHHHHHKGKRVHRSLSRRIFLLLTEPQTSIASFIFFIILVLAITFSNVLMMMQTMESFQFKPDDCVICGGTNEYYSTNDDALYTGPPLPDFQNLPVDCECPPVPLPWTIIMEDVTIWFFTVEWIMRVICYEPASAPSWSEHHSVRASLKQKLSYIMEWTTILDALAIFPYYIERYEKTNGLLSLRLLRLFRVFQLLRLGKYNSTFLSLMNVLVESMLSFNILLIVLLFGAAFFGSMIYWMEKGEWRYTTYSDPPMFAYMRIAADGVSEEPSPFTSIPASFWWFIVTATTVGYGDTYPTSLGGKCVAALAMLMGVLVIAFPVSVFSDLWSKELQKAGVWEKLDSTIDSISGDENGGSGMRAEADKDNIPAGIHEQKQQPKDAIVISADDLSTIRSHLRRIDESQLEIRRILDKY